MARRTSFYAEPKNHREEQKWSPVVYFDRPRCILCYRCVRMCGEGMDVFALGIQNRGELGGDCAECAGGSCPRTTWRMWIASSAACALTRARWAR